MIEHFNLLRARESALKRQLHAAVAAGLCSYAGAGITVYGNDDREAWFDDVGADGTDITTIGFAEFTAGTHITGQYRELGITFDGQNIVRGEDSVAYPQDGWAMQGQLDIAFEFDSPQNAIAAGYLGGIRFLLYRQGNLVGEESFFPSGPGNFAGLISSTPFDSVVIDRFGVDPVFVDDIHFAFIPTPGGMIPLLLLCLARRQGRRRDEPSI